MQVRLLRLKRQQISKGRNSGFWVAPKIYLFGTTKTLDRITGRGYNNVHHVRRTHKTQKEKKDGKKVQRVHRGTNKRNLRSA